MLYCGLKSIDRSAVLAPNCFFYLRIHCNSPYGHKVAWVGVFADRILYDTAGRISITNGGAKKMEPDSIQSGSMWIFVSGLASGVRNGVPGVIGFHHRRNRVP